MHSFPRLVGPVALVLCALGVPASSEVAVLTVSAPSVDPSVQGWSLGKGAEGTGVASPLHALAPRLRVGATVSLEVVVPGAGVLSMSPLGIQAEPPRPRSERGIVRRAASPSADASRLFAPGRSLALAKPTLEQGDRHDVVAVRDSWLGIDELYALRDHEVKHDVLVHEEALAALGPGDVRFSWLVRLPDGTRLALERGGAVLRSASGAFLARVPDPLVADEGDGHLQAAVAWLELSGPATAPVLSVVVPDSWLRAPEREFPLHVDPTVSLQPASDLETGFVDELGNQQVGPMASGTLLQVGFGSDARSYAEFDTSGIADTATVTDVRLLVWIANHQNPSDPADCFDGSGNPVACPLDMEVKAVPSKVNVPPPVLHAAIPPFGGPGTYVAETIDGTGPDWCPDAYIFRDYDLGAQADADLEGQLGLDFFTVGFVSIPNADPLVTDPLFDHLDYIGFPEVVLSGTACATTDFPGTRITLVVTFVVTAPPSCDAGGPYLGDCPADPITLDGTGSSDPDGDTLTFAWTSDCSGSIDDADQAIATLNLDPSCGEDCTVTLAVDDGTTTVSCIAPVSVHDTTPPVVTPIPGDGVCLWPPRHDMYCLTDPASLVTVSDTCQNPTVRFLGCASDQPDEAREPGRPENGDGHFPDDCQVSDDGLQLCVRVERAGNDPEGRHYGVVVAVNDGCGNVTTTTGAVFVPHDRRGGSGGQDDPCLRGNKTR